MSQVDALIIGGASLDTLHIGGQIFIAPGGAGLYTALAARRAGAHVVLFAPRPDPMPEPLQPAAEGLVWLGPAIIPDAIPRLEIAHHGGGRATLVNASWGALQSLIPNVFPPDLPPAHIAHIAALPTANQQLAFIEACRARGTPRISAGTYAWLVSSDRRGVRAVFDAADLFFMNENEANLLFSSVDAARARPGQILFVTLGERGAQVIQSEDVIHVSGQPAVELDPTGAGDTFCGAVLAGLARGEKVEDAARAGVALAAEMIGAVGPARLMQ